MAGIRFVVFFVGVGGVALEEVRRALAERDGAFLAKKKSCTVTLRSERTEPFTRKLSSRDSPVIGVELDRILVCTLVTRCGTISAESAGLHTSRFTVHTACSRHMLHIS